QRTGRAFARSRGSRDPSSLPDPAGVPGPPGCTRVEQRLRTVPPARHLRGGTAYPRGNRIPRRLRRAPTVLGAGEKRLVREVLGILVHRGPVHDWRRGPPDEVTRRQVTAPVPRSGTRLR